MGTEKFVDRQRESNGEIGTGEVPGYKDDVRAAGPRRRARRTPERMHLVRSIGKRGERREARLDDGGEMKAREGGLRTVSRMATVKKLNLVKGELKNIYEDR